MSQSYAALGGWFEYLNEDCGYEEWSQYLVKKLRCLGAGASGIDIGCGNGYFTRALIKAGYAVTGIDISVSMLNKAKELSAKQGVRAEFLQGDITKLKLPAKVDFAVAINDCLNYVPQDKLKIAFSRVGGCLKKGGVFIFDISSEYKLKNVIGGNLFAEDAFDVAYMWFNSFKGDRVEMDLTLFERGEDGRYARSDEKHIQYVHSADDITAALHEAGFTFVQCEGHLGSPLTEDAQRINFICRK